MKRLFVDSGVILKSIFGDYGFSKSIFALCAARIHQLVLAEVVRQEIENNLLQAFINRGARTRFSLTLTFFFAKRALKSSRRRQLNKFCRQRALYDISTMHQS